jgi:O-antigen/teichoic acid export membrane protein
MNLVTVLPFVALVFLSAEDMIPVILGERWAAAALPARILCLVGVLRALSFLGPPLLDGMGKPHLTLRYMTIAAITLTGLFVGCAQFLGPRLDYLSVAWAWALGYPVAFAALAYMTVAELDVPVRDFWRRIRGIPACVAIGTAAAYAASYTTRSLGHGLHLVVVAGTLIAVTFLLLGYTQGINPRAIKAALKGS